MIAWTRVQVFLYLLFICIGKVSAKEQTENARQLLTDMAQAMSTLNYQGKIALFRNGKLDTLQFYHAVHDGVEQERLVSLNSPLRESIRTAEQVKCHFLDTKKVIVDHRPSRRSFLMDMPNNLESAEKYYSFQLVGNETIAALSARVVVLKPLDNFRYTRKIWLSKDSALPLKFEIIGDKGAILEQLVFTELQVTNSLPFAEIQVDQQSSVQHIHQLETLDFDRSLFELKKIPPGFQKVYYTRRSLHHSSKPVDHLLLSDGFSSISVYLEKTATKIKPVHQAAGAVNSYKRMLNDYQLTLMGEVPGRTLQYIADGIFLRVQDD